MKHSSFVFNLGSSEERISASHLVVINVISPFTEFSKNPTNSSSPITGNVIRIG